MTRCIKKPKTRRAIKRKKRALDKVFNTLFKHKECPFKQLKDTIDKEQL